MCLSITEIPMMFEITPRTKNHFWYAVKKTANPEIPTIGITLNKKWLQHAIIEPAETPPVPATVPVSAAVCLIEV